MRPRRPAISARLPVPLLLALRVAARRPRRVVLGVVSIAITVSGIFVALVLDAFLTTQPPLWQLLAVVLATVLVVAALTAVPARLSGRRPVTETLKAELA
jgi:peptidoglycan/LPS O-acetylase OafA/YrhL